MIHHKSQWATIAESEVFARLVECLCLRQVRFQIGMRRGLFVHCSLNTSIERKDIQMPNFDLHGCSGKILATHVQLIIHDFNRIHSFVTITRTRLYNPPATERSYTISEASIQSSIITNSHLPCLSQTHSLVRMCPLSMCVPVSSRHPSRRLAASSQSPV